LQIHDSGKRYDELILLTKEPRANYLSFHNDAIENLENPLSYATDRLGSSICRQNSDQNLVLAPKVLIQVETKPRFNFKKQVFTLLFLDDGRSF